MPLSNISISKLEELKTEFNNLPTISLKYQFWQEKLNYPYYFIYNLEHSSILDFLIHCKSPEETESLNKLILNEVRLKRTLTLIDSENLKSEILKRLRNVIKPYPILEKEIERLRSKVRTNEANKIRRGVNDFIQAEKSNFWIHGYEEFYLRGKEIDLTIANYSTPNLVALLNGNETAQYQIFIENTISNPSTKKLAPEHTETTLKQQILLLYYLGVIQTLDTSINKNKNHLLSKILNRSEKRVADSQTYFDHNSEHNSLTIPNLEFVVNLLEKTGYKEQAEKAKADLEKEKIKRK